MKIGLFDSGLGGLTILRAVVKALPEHSYAYYGDTANLPYGDKSEEEIYQLSMTAMEYLFGQGCSLIIIACNTASAETLRRLQDEYLPARYPERRILGVIIPTIETLLDQGVTEGLLMATKRTVDSKKYERELEKRSSALMLHTVATPGLVPLIEARKEGEALTMATEYINKAVEANPRITHIILGCTHYTELKTALREVFGEKIIFLSQDEIIPEKLREYVLAHTELTAVVGGEGTQTEPTRTIHLTAHRPDYDRITAQLLGGVLVDDGQMA
jgi:glutamate racemase